MKKWPLYGLSMIAIVSIVFGGAYFFEKARQMAEHTLQVNPYFLNVASLIFGGCIGMLLGLEHLLCERKREGSWKWNATKIIVMGIPSLYFSLSLILYTLQVQPIPVMLVRGNQIMLIFQIILGYVIVTSFYKKTPEREHQSI